MYVSLGGGGWFSVVQPKVINNTLVFISGFLGNFHVYCFTLISGYIFYYLIFEKNKYKSFKNFIKNKTKRLLVPYLFVALIWVIPITQIFFRYRMIEIINKYILGIAPSQLWFLLMLFNVFIIFWILAKIFKNKNILSFVLLFIFFCIGIIGTKITPNFFQIYRSFYFVSFFYIGFKLRQYGTKTIRKIPTIVWVATYLIMLLVLRYFRGIEGITFKAITIGFRFLLQNVGSLMAFIVLQNIADKINYNNKYFKMIDTNAMVIYMLHQQVIYILIKLLNGVVNSYINAGINFMGAILISNTLAILLMKFKITRFLIGEK